MNKLVAEACQSLGFERLKPQQMTAVLKFMEGNDVFVALPTGFGKSAIFGILPRTFDLEVEQKYFNCTGCKSISGINDGDERQVCA